MRFPSLELLLRFLGLADVLLRRDGIRLQSLDLKDGRSTYLSFLRNGTLSNLNWSANIDQEHLLASSVCSISGKCGVLIIDMVPSADRQFLCGIPAILFVRSSISCTDIREPSPISHGRRYRTMCSPAAVLILLSISGTFAKAASPSWDSAHGQGLPPRTCLVGSFLAKCLSLGSTCQVKWSYHNQHVLISSKSTRSQYGTQG